jgi:hypothetical protein
MKKQGLIGKTVTVSEPRENDLHNHSFQGTVVDIRDNGLIVSVEDQDGDVFDLDLDQITVEE